MNSQQPGIRVLSVGFGDTDEVIAADAANQWAMGVLPVIMSWLLRGHTCEVEKSPIIVAVQDSPERYGWTPHLGPVIARGYGPKDSDECVPEESVVRDLSPSAAFKPIFHSIHPYAAHNSVMWIESFAARYYSHNEVDATCRLNNQEFDEGREGLLAWAASWPESKASVLTKRQFILFEPTPVEQLKGSAGLAEELENEIAKTKRG